jgi:hypothetical protein
MHDLKASSASSLKENIDIKHFHYNYDHIY